MQGGNENTESCVECGLLWGEPMHVARMIRVASDRECGPSSCRALIIRRAETMKQEKKRGKRTIAEPHGCQQRRHELSLIKLPSFISIALHIGKLSLSFHSPFSILHLPFLLILHTSLVNSAQLPPQLPP